MLEAYGPNLFMGLLGTAGTIGVAGRLVKVSAMSSASPLNHASGAAFWYVRK